MSRDVMDDMTLGELRRLVFEVEEAAYPRVLVRQLLNRFDRLAADLDRMKEGQKRYLLLLGFMACSECGCSGLHHSSNGFPVVCECGCTEAADALASPRPEQGATRCRNGPDRETGEWPCNPIRNGDGTATCSECGWTGVFPEEGAKP